MKIVFRNGELNREIVLDHTGTVRELYKKFKKQVGEDCMCERAFHVLLKDDEKLSTKGWTYFYTNAAKSAELHLDRKVEKKRQKREERKQEKHASKNSAVLDTQPVKLKQSKTASVVRQLIDRGMI